MPDDSGYAKCDAFFDDINGDLTNTGAIVLSVDDEIYATLGDSDASLALLATSNDPKLQGLQAALRHRLPVEEFERYHAARVIQKIQETIAALDANTQPAPSTKQHHPLLSDRIFVASRSINETGVKKIVLQIAYPETPIAPEED